MHFVPHLSCVFLEQKTNDLGIFFVPWFYYCFFVNLSQIDPSSISCIYTYIFITKFVHPINNFLFLSLSLPSFFSPCTYVSVRFFLCNYKCYKKLFSDVMVSCNFSIKEWKEKSLFLYANAIINPSFFSYSLSEKRKDSTFRDICDWPKQQLFERLYFFHHPYRTNRVLFFFRFAQQISIKE